MRYGKVNEPQVKEEYVVYLKIFNYKDASASTGIHVDLKVKYKKLDYYYYYYYYWLLLTGWLNGYLTRLLYMILLLQTQMAY